LILRGLRQGQRASLDAVEAILSPSAFDPSFEDFDRQPEERRDEGAEELVTISI